MVWLLVLGFLAVVWWHQNVNPTSVVINGVTTPIVKVPTGDTANALVRQASQGIGVLMSPDGVISQETNQNAQKSTGPTPRLVGIKI